MKHRHLKKADLTKANPIAKAMAVASMRSHLTRVGLHIYTTQDGEPALDLLAHLAWLISLGAEIAANVAPGQLEARRLHLALRAVVQLATTGARWDASLATSLHTAAQNAHTLMLAHAHLGEQLIPSADHLSDAIRAGTATLADIAGDEIYHQPISESTQCR
jgi:hypothetical protein